MILTNLWSNPFDNAIAIWFSNLFNSFPEAIKEIVITFSALGNQGIFLLLLTIIFLCFKKTRTIGFLFMISLIFSLVFNDLIFKNIFNRTRPFNDPELVKLLPSIVENNGEPLPIIPGSKSFPSGHTFSSFVCFGSVLFYYLFAKEKGKGELAFAIFMGVYSLLMGLSRILLSHHYATDVIAGMLLGLLFGYLAYLTYKYFPLVISKVKSKFIKEEVKE